MAATNEYLTPTQAASVLKISKRTLMRQVAAGRLPAPVYIASRCPRWSRRALDARLAAMAKK